MLELVATSFETRAAMMRGQSVWILSGGCFLATCAWPALLLIENYPFKYLWSFRVPFLLACLVCFLPAIALRLAPDLLRNLYVVPRATHIAAIAFSVATCGAVVFSTFTTIFEHGGARFGSEGIAPTASPWLYLAVVPLCIPTLAALFSGRRLCRGLQDPLHRFLMAALSPAAAAIAVALAWPTLRGALVDAVGRWPFLAAWSELEFARGYLEGNALGAAHVNALVLIALALLAYAIAGVRYRPRFQPVHTRSVHPSDPARPDCVYEKQSDAPTLAFLYVIAAAFALFWGAFAFLLDLYTIPSLPLLLGWSILMFGVKGGDHYYKLFDRRSSSGGDSAPPPEFSEAVSARLQRLQSQRDTVVVVSASGGGIQAAAWTAQVLVGLHAQLGEEFTKRIILLSGVSGGAVGLMHYLDRFTEAGYPEVSSCNRIVEAASRESLDATGWGLAYPDLFRMIGAGRCVPPHCDRGHALETDWRNALQHPKATLHDWGECVRSGQMPTPVFNATLVEDGRRFLLSPVVSGGVNKHNANERNTAAESAGPESRSVDFFHLFPGKDLSVTTAARLSATFPYVTPICRNDAGVGVHHVADGGYFDNFGVFTSVEWLHRLLASEQDTQKIQRVLFLEISAFPDQEDLGDSVVAAEPFDITKRKYWNWDGLKMAFLGPLQALTGVRNSTQVARNRFELEQLSSLWARSQVEIQRQVIQFPLLDEGAFRDQEGKGYAPPLSWKLSPHEQQAIADAWKEYESSSFGPLKTLWADWGFTPRASGGQSLCSAAQTRCGE